MVYLIIFTFLGFLTGYFIFNKYKTRYLVYKNSLDFFSYYKLKVGFSSDKIINIINTFTFNKNLIKFKEHLINYYKSKKINNSDYLFYIKYLNDRENMELNNYYLSLGKLGKEFEVEKLENYIKNIDLKKDETYDVYKKYGVLYIKIFTMLGAIIGLILL